MTPAYEIAPSRYFAKPSNGLEPLTPSLPLRLLDGEEVDWADVRFGRQEVGTDLGECLGSRR